MRNRGDAQTYHRFASQAAAPWDRLLLNRALDQCPEIAAGGVVVDVGTGSATVPIAMANHPRFAACRFVGIEYYADMARIARERVVDAGLSERIDVLEDDAQALSLPDGEAILVLCRATLHHLPAPELALKEMWRITKPGGVVIVHDLRRDAPPALVAQLNASRAKLGYPPTVISEKLTLNEVDEIVARAGLHAHAAIHTGESGSAAIGFEILLRKP